jgi:hypothetical protein
LAHWPERESLTGVALSLFELHTCLPSFSHLLYLDFPSPHTLVPAVAATRSHYPHICTFRSIIFRQILLCPPYLIMARRDSTKTNPSKQTLNTTRMLPGTQHRAQICGTQYVQPLATEIVVDQEQSLELVRTVISAAVSTTCHFIGIFLLIWVHQISNITWIRYRASILDLSR